MLLGMTYKKNWWSEQKQVRCFYTYYVIEVLKNRQGKSVVVSILQMRQLKLRKVNLPKETILLSLGDMVIAVLGTVVGVHLHYVTQCLP